MIVDDRHALAAVLAADAGSTSAAWPTYLDARVPATMHLRLVSALFKPGTGRLTQVLHAVEPDPALRLVLLDRIAVPRRGLTVLDDRPLAGSGKSRTLGAARQAWEAAGAKVRGVAPSAVAAGVLSEQAGIPSETLAKFLLDASKGRLFLQRGEVVICDEASMVSTRDLARLVLLVEASGAKLVLVGDHYQLGSVEAGGLFRLLATDAKTAELTGIRRFRDPWEAQATRRLRRGDQSVIDEYIDRDRVRAGDRDEALDAAHHAWLDARQHGRSVVVMATDHDTVDQLALRARAVRIAAGEVQPEGIVVGQQTVGLGDEIVTTHNDRALVTTTGAWVRNGDRWQIVNRDRGGALQLVSLDGRGTVTLPSGYVEQYVALSYAVTVHKAQGVTVDQAVLVLDRSTAAEHLYVGLTRGRYHNQTCVITGPAGDEHTRREPPAAEVLSAALRKISTEKSATETVRGELDRSAQSARPAASIVEGLRQAHAHSLNQTIRKGSSETSLRRAAPRPHHRTRTHHQPRDRAVTER